MSDRTAWPRVQGHVPLHDRRALERAVAQLQALMWILPGNEGRWLV